MYVFNYSNIGFRHLRNDTVIQDFSASYIDNERTIITCCDGHGGNKYIRSNAGSKFASDAIIDVLKNVSKSDIYGTKKEKAITSIRLSILCEWNRLVENDLANNKIKATELLKLNEFEKFGLLSKPQSAYGTTLAGAMVLGNSLIIVSIGDTEVLGVRKGELVQLFDTSNDPAGNITYSMCQDDAYKYLRVLIFDKNSLDGVILCTDGLSGPYQSYDNFNASFVKPMIHRLLIRHNYQDIKEDIKDIAEKEGTGDDVSLSFILFDNLNDRYYRRS